MVGGERIADPSRGRRQLLIVVGAVATLFSLMFARDVWRDADSINVAALGRIVILLGLAAAAFRGFRRARECLVAFFGYLTLRSAFSAVFGMTVAPILGFALLGLTAAFAYGTYVLFTSKDVEAFLTAQRTS